MTRQNEKEIELDIIKELANSEQGNFKTITCNDDGGRDRIHCGGNISSYYC